MTDLDPAPRSSPTLTSTPNLKLVIGGKSDVPLDLASRPLPLVRFTEI
jgi:hypothetical protein